MRLQRLLSCREAFTIFLFGFLSLHIYGVSTADTNVSGTISTSTTWTLTGSPYSVTGNVEVKGTASPVLTIQAGVVVKFNSAKFLRIGSGQPGALQVLGTAAQPVIFQANTVSPTPGFWSGLIMETQTVSASSQLAFFTVRHAQTGLTLNTCKPLVHHGNFENNSLRGIYNTPNSPYSPPMYQNSFVGNGSGTNNWGIFNNTGVSTNTITSYLSWWNAATGPTTTGGGAAQRVTSTVRYEPWLTALPAWAHYFDSFSNLNRTFNPSLSIYTTLNFTMNQSGNWTVTFTDSTSTVLKTFTGSGTSGNVIWDGKNQAGVAQPNATYTYEVQSTAGANTATPAKGQVVIDNTKQFSVTGFATTQTYISPNADTVQDTATISANINFDANWTINIRNSGGTIVRTVTGIGMTVSFVFDGKNNSGVLQPDGVYTVEFSATAGTASYDNSLTITIDNTIPVAIITSPTAGQVLSNIYQSGATIVPVTGTATDLNLISWATHAGVGSNPSSWPYSISSGTAGVTNGSLGLWHTSTLTNGTYTIRLRVTDRAGNVGLVLRTVTVGNFSASKQTIYQVNGSTGGTLTYTSIVPFTLTETLVIKNQAGQIVRTLVNTSRNAGTFNDIWNIKNDQNAFVPDGAYFYVATVIAGTYTLVWDRSNVFPFAENKQTYYPTTNFNWDPYNNQPLTFTYNFTQAGRVNVGFSPTNALRSDCQPPTYCLQFDVYEESGAHTVRWSGIDNTGLLRSEMRYAGACSRRHQFAENAIVVFGTKPSITNLVASPSYYFPSAGNQNVSFTLATYQSQTANVSISFINQSSLSTLRTVTSNNVPAGSVSIPWDGRADNGTWLAPGPYAVIVSVTDSLGNVVKSQTLMKIHY